MTEQREVSTKFTLLAHELNLVNGTFSDLDLHSYLHMLILYFGKEDLAVGYEVFNLFMRRVC